MFDLFSMVRLGSLQLRPKLPMNKCRFLSLLVNLISSMSTVMLLFWLA